MGEEIMEYIDRQTGITVTDEDFKEIYKLGNYIMVNRYFNRQVYSPEILYINGLRVETFSQPEYKDLPIDWVLALFK